MSKTKSQQLINQETGHPIAMVLEDLPPLREGYARVLHLTGENAGEPLAEYGLVYNAERLTETGKKAPVSTRYTDAGSMSVPVCEESFWNIFDEKAPRSKSHLQAKRLAVFDMPTQEYMYHHSGYATDIYDGAISRGYMVGFVPVETTKDGFIKKYSSEKVSEMKKKSQSNPLPPAYETPRWQETYEQWIEKRRKESERDEFQETYNLNDDDMQKLDKLDTARRLSAAKAVLNKRRARNEAKNNAFDPLEYKQENIANDLKEAGLSPEDMGKTGDSRTGEISPKHKKIAAAQMTLLKNRAHDDWWD